MKSGNKLREHNYEQNDDNLLTEKIALKITYFLQGSVKN